MRIAVSEWSWKQDLVGQFAAARKVSDANAEVSLRLLGERVQKSLHFKKSPLDVSSSGVRAKGIAGILGLDRDFEIEIAPKYASAENGQWRQDLLFMTLLSKHGSLLLQNPIGAKPSTFNDLTSLVADVLLKMFSSNRQNPLKTYRFIEYHDFALEGEFDPQEIVLPHSDGFAQHRYHFDPNNEYSATVKAAVLELCGRVRDPALYSKLRSVSAQLSSVTAAPSVVRRTLPARLGRWQGLYDLSFDVARGFGLSPGDNMHRIPGFVVSTWQIWQDLVGRALVLAFGPDKASLQHRYVVGQALRDGKVTPVGMTPDAVLVDEVSPVILDAKYKGHSDRRNDGINDTDFYEVLAYMRAASAKRAILIYPATSVHAHATGTTKVLEKIEMSNGEVLWAVSVEVNGISMLGGFSEFVAGLKARLETLMSEPLSI